MKYIPLVLGLTGFLCAASADAQLAHRYDMATANDTVGTANGTLTGAATITGGLLTTTGGSGDYLALPATVGAGITGDFSIQTFVILQTNPGNFSSLFSLSSEGNRNFFLVNPSRPNADGTLSTNFQQKIGVVNGGADTEVDIRPATTTSFPFGTAEHDLTFTYVASTNIVSVYLDGNPFASGSIAAALSGSSLSLADLTGGGPNSITKNGINGNGPFGDASINGSTDDFRVYSSALTATQVSLLHTAGAGATNAAIAVIVPEPSTWVMMSLGLVALCGLQRFRRRQA